MITDLIDTTRFVGSLTTSSIRSVVDLARSRSDVRRSPRASGGAERTEYHPFLPAVLDDPYPFYAALLEGGPVHYNAEQDTWIVSRYDDVRAALRADDVLSSAQGVLRQRSDLPMLNATGRPGHTAMRRTVAGAFTRAGLERWRAAVEETCDAFAAEVVRRERVEVVGDLAAPVPTEVIARMLGVPVQDRNRFRRWSDTAIQAFNLSMEPRSLGPFGRSLVAIVALRRYFRGRLDRCRDRPGDDLLGDLVRAARDGSLSDEQVFWFAFLLLVAGNETTTNLVSGLLHTLARDPGLQGQLRDRPDLIPAAVEEQLRFRPPVHGFYRTALRDYPVGPCTVPAGARVLVLFAAANHDPRRYADPGRFCLDRQPSDHLAFGSGIHFCLGAYLSKMEALRVLQRLLEATARIELDGMPSWGRNPLLRGADRMPLRFVAHDRVGGR